LLVLWFTPLRLVCWVPEKDSVPGSGYRVSTGRTWETLRNDSTSQRNA